METIKKWCEIKKITQDLKEVYNKDMECLIKKNQTEVLEIKVPWII
jgi:hypothetical protein